MDARRTKEIEGQDRLREETIPFGERKLGINGAKDRNKVILECPNGTFGGVGTVFFGWDALEMDQVFGEGVLEVLGTLVV